MTEKQEVFYNLLPRTEGLLRGVIEGLEVEDFNREGCKKILE